jgi:hypothetical protein
MARLAILLGVQLLVVMPAVASNAVSLGYSEETTIVGPERECSGGTLVHNHDGSFETGYTWQYGGCQYPYYGAFGEGYDLGAGTIECGAYWVSTVPGFCDGYPADCYVWEGGIGSTPGQVLAVVTGVLFTNMPMWPTVGQNDVDMNVPFAGGFTVGYWGVWPGSNWCFGCAADVDGPPGHPWTCIAPGIGYPSGWQDPSIVWGPTSSMGCGVYFESNPTPAESETWGAVKALYR